MSELSSEYGSRKSVREIMDITEINSENIGELYDVENYKGITDALNYLYRYNTGAGGKSFVVKYFELLSLIDDLIMRAVQENSSEFLYELLADEGNPYFWKCHKINILSEIIVNGSLDLTETLFRVLEGINFTMKNLDEALQYIAESMVFSEISGDVEVDAKLLMMIESLEYKGLIDPEGEESQMVLLYAFSERFENSARQLNRLGIWLSPVKCNYIRGVYPGIEKYFEDN